MQPHGTLGTRTETQIITDCIRKIHIRTTRTRKGITAPGPVTHRTLLEQGSGRKGTFAEDFRRINRLPVLPDAAKTSACANHRRGPAEQGQANDTSPLYDARRKEP